MISNSGKGTLYLIPVPLAEGEPGSSLTYPALEVILSLNTFIVEDIRSARRFLRSAGYQGDFSDISFHIFNEHSTSEVIPPIIQSVLAGDSAGLLSEAGAPCIADPGALLVAAAHAHQIKVVPLIGPSSILLALMASGFNGQHFVFHGYLPVKNPQRINKIKELETDAYRKDQTQIFIETPYRNKQLFDTLIQTCKNETRLCIARNLGSPDELIISNTISWWKTQKPDLHKKPAVFLIYR